jgi:hypothetical protein
MAIKLDSVKYKAQAVGAWAALTSYYNDVKRDSKTALDYVDKILALDPSNAFANQVKPILQKAVNRASQPKKSSSTSSKPSSAAKK